ncbi:ATP-binding protein [Candidatus Woesearchaeota archaeon]|nr:ATP-binding protein [Candidatus Woesearchaeota archaeon]
MVRTKKQHWSWRATKATARGLWSVAKFTGKQVSHGVRWSANKAHEAKKARTMRTSAAYNAVAVYGDLRSVSKVSGNHDNFEQQLLNSSRIMLLFGKRGSGKSALGFRLMENVYSKTERPCYVLGVPQEVLPKWISSVQDIGEVKNHGVVLVDEGALAFSARESMKKEHKELGKLMAIARHKDMTLIFITQNTGMIDKNVLQLTDTLLVKEGSLLQMEMERSAVQKFYKKAEAAFSKLDDKRKYAYVIDGDFEGVVECLLPSFWSEKVSKSRA